MATPDAARPAPGTVPTAAPNDLPTPASQPAAAPPGPTSTPAQTIPAAAPGAVAAPSPAPAGGASRALLAEDDAVEVEPGQMKRSEFLAEVRGAVTATMEPILARAGRSTDGCPYLEFVFRFFEGRNREYLEQTLRRFGSGAGEIETVADYIPYITERVRRSTEIWLETGEIRGLPRGVPSGLTWLAATADPAAEEAEAASAGPLFLKSRGGRAAEQVDPAAIQASLGRGTALEGGVRSRMESVFGHSFAHVRTHTDAQAAGLAGQLNARAFTVGSHVAFGNGEYRPGTMVGDALIAHELAHVVQQGWAASSGSRGGAAYGTLEEDADQSAVSAVVGLWGGLKSQLGDIRDQAVPRLRSGLRLQRCDDKKQGQSQQAQPAQPQPAQPQQQDGCVTGNLTAKTSGTLQGGFSVNDYLAGSSTWGNVGSPTTAGRDGTGFKVQIVGPYSGRENLGVSQTLTFRGANQAFLDDFAQYSGVAAGSISNGTAYPEPVLDANDPFATRPWILRYDSGMVSFADVPRNGPGRKGDVEFNTCFHSKGTHCTHSRCCVIWTWSIDFTGTNNTNTVTQGTQQCT